MKPRNYFYLLACLLLASGLSAQRTSFAVVIDHDHLSALQKEIDVYRQSLEKDGLKVHLVVPEKGNPEEIREKLQALFKTDYLEGAVLIGNIPVPMIRDAQHLTSTFKMPQTMDWIESSVPSDRFYDDFGLRFEFLKQDDSLRNLYYYRLLPEGRQAIRMDIYTGRIKAPTRDTKESIEYIRRYLAKVTAERQARNSLNHVITFTGEGYNSNALNSWGSLLQGYREQFAPLYRYPNVIRFMDFRAHDNVKPVLMSALANKELDFAYLNGHGLPEEQILSGNPEVSNPAPSMENVAFYVRAAMRKVAEEKRAERQESLQKSLGLNGKWFENAFDQEQVSLDSIYNSNKVIAISDLKSMEVNARVVYLDACFTGAFQYDEYLAAFYPFNSGKSLVAFANSVGVLQDLWANELIGLLQTGTRTGQILKHTAYLETHIFGDPSFHFAYQGDIGWNHEIAHQKKPAFWLKKTSADLPDVVSLGLRKLAEVSDREKSIDILRRHFEESPFATVRTEAFILLGQLRPEDWHRIVSRASEDNFEYLRRISTYEMSEIGDPGFIEPLVNLYFRDRSSNRTGFNVGRMLLFFDKDAVQKAIDNCAEAKQTVDQSFVEALKEDVRKESFFDKAFSDLITKEATGGKVPFAISILRAYRFHQHIPTVLGYLEKNRLDPAIAIPALEALSWFGKSIVKKDILDACARIQLSAQVPEEIKREAERTSAILRSVSE